VSTARREPIAKVDTAWLRMEQPTNLMMITGVMVLSEAVSFDHFREIIANRFLAFPAVSSEGRRSRTRLLVGRGSGL
jgi:diacylglycerol O-acyltransferase / wax synthase